MIDSVGRTRQAIEVLAQDLARQKNRADAKASPANFGRDEVLISFVLLGLAYVSDGRLVEITTLSGGGILGDKDFGARCIRCWNWKHDLVSEGDVRDETAGQKKFCLIRKHAGGWVRAALNAHHTLAAYRNRRAERS